jgi:protoheme IX farnesyltransferase
MTTPAVAVPNATARDWVLLTKPGITTMVVFTTMVGFVSASGRVEFGLLAVTLAGTALVAAAAAVLNQVIERDTDALMWRTRDRPLPTGRVGRGEAVAFGVVLGAVGLTVLAALANGLSAAVAAATLGSYLGIYTPLKRRTSLATLVGAVPGALPPVIGWAAARGSLESGAFLLFAILFLWQIPHFLAIAWLYRDDYARGGFPMLPVLDREGTMTARQTVVHSLALLLVSLAPFAAGLAGPWYLPGALVLGVGLVFFALRLASARDLASARSLFLASVAYLPALCSVLLATRA